MTPEQAEAVAAADNATMAIVTALIAFLEKQGAMRREDFAAYLEAAVAGWRAEGTDEKLVRLIEIKARGICADLPTSVQN
ncbi:hypothetical protein [Methylobacterium oxalidis]|uniref:Uncharacterized protein n=1 Tax=Methylobacterium oxalidis TaxID=944322 RepID=A0A512J2S9_9HYPH|nr:hypothetical protein [Methylobacterium oxalidis]GEP04264.1 hypothetical protein MOX02_23020 [Methylobacterium oxalidis]GJE35083.1 hypothetical protein LDDCCGHA_5301 [Methylobacterium oxalidis]GLS67217.1 hypothetical protein GCM10007888_56000 [Methylobacterium oxalidis]